MNIYLEIFGYIGTALVIISMMMTSVLKLRIINMCGGLISLVYAVLMNTWPVVVLNACLICINFVQTVRELRGREAVAVVLMCENHPTVQHLLGVWKKDFEKYYPDCDLQETQWGEIHILYVGQQAVGFLIGTRNAELFSINTGYLIPSCRTAAMVERIFAVLRKDGIRTLTSCEFHNKYAHRYLRRMGFDVRDGLLAKQI